MFGDLGAAIQEFQSTLSVRRATSSLATKSPSWLFQSTLSVRRATHLIDGLMYFIIISIHALREESDGSPPRSVHRVRISIHALREESDFTSICKHLLTCDFNPRSP